MRVRRLEISDRDEWARLRAGLWPGYSVERHQEQMEEILGNPEQKAVFVSPTPDGHLQGFLEASIRPFADACKTRPVGYIEGWYVEPEARRQGTGRALVEAAEEWARVKECEEIGSDTPLENQLARLVHKHIGYEEVERLVLFRRSLSCVGDLRS